jgi:hypothetical protein
LLQFQADEEDLDKWRVLNMHHQALYKSSGSDSPASDHKGYIFKATPTEPPVARAKPSKVNLKTSLDQKHLAGKLLQAQADFKEKVSQSKPPKLIAEESFQAPKRSTGLLLEQAELLLARNDSFSSPAEAEIKLRALVQDLHIKALRER